MLYAQGFWVLSGLLCVCGSLIQHKLYASLAFVVSCCLPFYFGYSFSTIYSDALLGVAFAACLCLTFGINQDISRFRLIAFAICAATLTLIKEIAVVLVFIATAVFLLKLIFGSQHDNSISETRRLPSEVVIKLPYLRSSASLPQLLSHHQLGHGTFERLMQ